MALGHRRDLGAPFEHGRHRVGEISQPGQHGGRGRGAAQLIGERERQEEPGGDLRVEGLRRRDAHLHVTPVGGVEHPGGSIHQVAVAAVHDGDDHAATGPYQVHGAVRVGGRAALADRDDERVGHVDAETEARQLGCGHRLDVDATPGFDRAGEHMGQVLARDRRGSLTDHEHAADLTGAQAGAQLIGQGLGTERHRQVVVVFDELAAEGLTERVGCFGDLFQQEVAVVAPVDVPGGDLGDGDVGFGDGKLGPVIGAAVNAGEGSGTGRVELDDLTAARLGVGVVGGGLAVHTHIARGLFDQPVGLAGHDEGVLTQAHVQRLTAAPQREQQAVGFGRGADSDGDRALEPGDGGAEGLGGRLTGAKTACGERGDNLGVGGDLGCEAEPFDGDEIGVVVDVAVEHRGHVRLGARTGPVAFVATERVGIGFGDDADAGPTGVAQHRHPGRVVGECETQQRVGPDRGAQRGGVVAQLADLGRRLVHERDAPVGGAHHPGPKQRIAAALGQQPGDRRVIEVERVVAHEEVETGRVAPAYLEPVDGTERDLYRPQPVDRGTRRPITGEVGHRAGGADPVVPDGPAEVLQPDHLGVEPLELSRDEIGVAAVKHLVDSGHQHVEIGNSLRELDGRRRLAEQRPDPGGATQSNVHSFDVDHGLADRGSERRGEIVGLERRE